MGRNSGPSGGVKASGPYSHSVRAGDFIFVSGQLPVDPGTGRIVGDDVASQLRCSLENLGRVLEASGAGFGEVVKTTVYVADLRQFDAVNRVYAEYFGEPYPARSTVQAAALPKGVLAEVEAVAYVGARLVNS